MKNSKSPFQRIFNQSLGHLYSDKGCIGNGSMGHVRLIVRKLDGFHFAVKIVEKEDLMAYD